MLDLFQPAFDREVLATRLSALAERNVYVGTSSWKYSGWLGLVYDRSRYETRTRFSEKRFQEQCLEEFSQFFRTVCVDAGYYRFPDEQFLEKLVSQVPAHFRFSFKVTDTVTLRRFPNLSRFGFMKGRLNPDFLNAELFEKAFLRPLEPFRSQIGVLIFELADFHLADFAGFGDFLDQLGKFFEKLPTGWQYAVELRTIEFFADEYLSLLNAYHVAHVFNQWTRMPDVGEQLIRNGTVSTDFVVGRFLLRKGRTFKEAIEKFYPYDQVREVNEEARQAARNLIWDVPMKKGRPSFLYLGNRLEGNSPTTIYAVTDPGG
jgi:uncharacterized protein YecE (DUF72 family)